LLLLLLGCVQRLRRLLLLQRLHLPLCAGHSSLQLAAELL
jgi:hypothetical protein